jgi:hypothetical protein
MDRVRSTAMVFSKQWDPLNGSILKKQTRTNMYENFDRVMIRCFIRF